MKDSEYLEKMIALTEELNLAHSAEPFNRYLCNELLARINALHLCRFHRRRRRPWTALAFCISLLIVLVWIVYEVLCVLYAKGS